MRSLPLAIALLVGSSLLGVVSCRSATELTVTVRTNVPCDEVESWQGIAVYVGKPDAESERQAPTLVTNHCEGDGFIGTLVVVPSGAKDEVVGVRVVAGVGRRAEDCAANGYEGGCIVARRSIRFTPHSDLALDINLSSTCLDIGCDPKNTCVERRCEPSSAPPPTSPQPSGSEPPSGTEPSVRCGDDGVFCPTSGDVCCLTVDVAAGTTRGDCRRASLCKGVVLNCDDDEDCPRGGFDNAFPGICALSYLAADDQPYVPLEIVNSQCLIAVYGTGGTARPHSLGLCEDHRPCAGDQFECSKSVGEPNLLPGYHWCQMYFQ